MEYPNTEKLNKAEADLINDLCPNEKAKFDEWLNELKGNYLHVIGYIDIRYWYDIFMSGADTDEAATMIQTPCIMKFKDDYLLYLDDTRHFNLTTMKLRKSAIESCDSNVTNQYLQNTYGEVQSPEHTEFIIKLAVNAGIDFDPSNGESHPRWFVFIDDELYFIGVDRFTSENRKQITIPLPPKAKDWVPEIGDNVVITDKHNKLEGELLALTKEYAIISQPYGEQHLHLSGWSFEKPKSAQELKIEELQTKLCENDAVDNYTLACDIVMGNIEGLIYE